jgi:hypothetical protein
MTFPTAPGDLGHEGWGVVDALGKGVSDIVLGERVAMLSGNAYAEYDVADAASVVRIPAGLDGAAFPGEPFGCAMNIFRRSGIEPGQTVAILGIGFLGAILVRLASSAGARVIAISRRQESLDLATRMGAAETIPMHDHYQIIEQVKQLTGERFCERVIEAVGKQWPLDLAAASHADRLLGVDLSYRHTAAMQAIRERVQAGDLGRIFAADLTFHNAYGPGAGWFWDPALSGGGCLIDLGVHLVDLALWLLDFPEVTGASSVLLRDGRPVQPGEVEDYAVATLSLASGTTVRIACSWNLNSGADAVIEATLYGTRSSARMRNEAGSFFDFSADLLTGRESRRLASPPDDWGGRAAAEWVRQLAGGARFTGSTSGLLDTSRSLDLLYASASRSGVTHAPG